MNLGLGGSIKRVSGAVKFKFKKVLRWATSSHLYVGVNYEPSEGFCTSGEPRGTQVGIGELMKYVVLVLLVRF